MNNQNPAPQRLGPIGRHALTLMLPDEVFASRGKQEAQALLDPFASHIRHRQYEPVDDLFQGDSGLEYICKVLQRS